MTDQMTPLVALPGFQIMCVAIAITMVATLYWLRSRHKQIIEIGELALKASKQPTRRQWQRLAKAAEETDTAKQLHRKLTDLKNKLGVYEIRRGHFVALWHMVLGEASWDIELPRFPTQKSFDAWISQEPFTIAL